MAFTLNPVALLRPVTGNQEHEIPPVAVKVFEPPIQTEEFADTVPIGDGWTVITTTFELLTQPLISVPTAE